MTGEQLIIEVEKITQANLDFVQRKLKHLSEDQLQWKQNDKTWSIEEVFAHMNSFSAFYHPVF
ncbi:MAG: DinB family protein, partial [Bacteroidetes bacterium]|nr:DinB family protein [Bacteroidota bacterium]